MKTTENNKRHFWAIALALLLASYPIAVHISVVINQSWPALAVLAAFCLIGFMRSLLSAQKAGAVVFLSMALVIGLVTTRYPLINLLYLQPILINACGFYLFFRTLLPGETPLVSRFAALVRGQLHPDVAHYTRRVTQAWACFFALLTMESLLLALYAPAYVWSLFTNLINYLLVAGFFVLEYLIRLRTLASFDHPSFLRYLRNLLKPEIRSSIR